MKYRSTSKERENAAGAQSGPPTVSVCGTSIFEIFFAVKTTLPVFKFIPQLPNAMQLQAWTAPRAMSTNARSHDLPHSVHSRARSTEEGADGHLRSKRRIRRSQHCRIFLNISRELLRLS